jgi:hypothetical protein
MNFSKNMFFSPEECQYMIDFSMEHGEKFSYTELESTSWDCRRIYDEGFKETVIHKFIDLYSNDQIKFWFDFNTFDLRNVNVSLTRYYDGRFLQLHRDTTSNYTTVISLTDNYKDGRFVLSDQMFNGVHDDRAIKLNLALGEGVTFEGTKTYHGVMPVTTGLRCALNIWMNDTEFEYYKLDTKRKLI